MYCISLYTERSVVIYSCALHKNMLQLSGQKTSIHVQYFHTILNENCSQMLNKNTQTYKIEQIQSRINNLEFKVSIFPKSYIHVKRSGLIYLKYLFVLFLTLQTDD